MTEREGPGLDWEKIAEISEEGNEFEAEGPGGRAINRLRRPDPGSLFLLSEDNPPASETHGAIRVSGGFARRA